MSFMGRRGLGISLNYSYRWNVEIGEGKRQAGRIIFHSLFLFVRCYVVLYFGLFYLCVLVITAPMPERAYVGW